MASSINASTSGAGGVITTADSSGVLNIQTVGNTAVTVDASQNVGIGTTSPGDKLTVIGAGQFNVNANGTSTPLKLSNDNTTGTVVAKLAFQNQGNIKASINGAVYNSDFLTFNTGSDTERMRIDSSGNLLVNTTSQLLPGGVGGIGNIVNPSTSSGQWALALQNNGTAGGSGRGIGIRNATDFNSAANEVWYFVGNATARGYFLSNGGLYNFQANNVNISDRSTKKDITPAKNYLDIICSIPVVTFLYNDQTDNDLNLGVIAQDVEAVAPELITVTKLGVDQDTNEEKVLKGIYQTDLQYALMKCIQEQQAIIEDLKSRITALEAK